MPTNFMRFAALILIASTCWAQHTPSGPLNIANVSNQTYENLHVTSTTGPCVTMTNSSNITFHNSEIGPCDSTDVNCTNVAGGQAFLINGGSGIKIVDNYIHTQCPGIVNKTGTQTIYDNGDNIFATSTSGLLVQGNIIAWGETNVGLQNGDPNATVQGNYLLNPIASMNLFQRGQQIVVGDGSNNAIMAYNYVVADNGHTFGAFAADQLSAAAFTPGDQEGVTINNNWITGGGVQFQCAINMDGGANGNPSGPTSTITNNALFNIADCGLSIESGYNYIVTGNKNLSTNTGNTTRNGIQAFQCYAGPGSACPTGQIIPCGNITYTNNLSYSILPNNSIVGASIKTNPPTTLDGCTNVSGNVSGTSGNFYDSGTGPCPGSGTCNAYNAMQPMGSDPFPAAPAIPPVPYSCVTASPFTNNVAVIACGASPPPANQFGRLNTKIWTFVNPVGDGSYNLPGKQIDLIVPGGVNHDPTDASMDNSVRIIQTIASSDFDVTIKFDTIPSLRYQLMGLIVDQDSSNYLRFGFAATGTGSPVFASAYTVVAGVLTEVISQQIANPSGTSLWLEVQRSGNAYTLLHSLDNVTYTTDGTFTQAFTIADFGPFGGNFNGTPAAAPSINVLIDYFKVNSGVGVSDNFNSGTSAVSPR